MSKSALDILTIEELDQFFVLVPLEGKAGTHYVPAEDFDINEFVNYVHEKVTSPSTVKEKKEKKIING